LFIGSQQATFEQYFIIDIGDWLNRPDGVTPSGSPKTISEVSGRGHSTRTATINGVPYLLHSEESVGVVNPCAPETANPFAGVAQPWLTNIHDRTNPRLVSQIALDINNPKNCPEAAQSGVGASVHYHDVDNPNDTTFVMASMGNAGIRIWDVRDPVKPTEVGYFNPSDVNPTPGSTSLDRAWAHIHYVPEKGEIWFTTASGGFWVVRIEGGLRNYLALDKKVKTPLNVPKNDPGRPGTVGVRLPVLPPTAYTSPAPYYCTIGALVAPTNAATRPLS